MIEVFKTDVKDRSQAVLLLAQIHQTFAHYTAQFDLDDCDRILRVHCSFGSVQSLRLIELLNDFGFQAEVLSDEADWVAPLPDAIHPKKSWRYSLTEVRTNIE